MSEARPKLTVCVLAYNHAAFIAQALDSILMQETPFDFEVLVGEDESSDGTREIVEDYASRHPGKLQILRGKRSEAIRIMGITTGRRNLVNLLARANGEFVALLEGDDYWTDKTKLARQVAHLEAHPDAVLCFHPVDVRREEGDTFSMESQRVVADGERFRLEDLLSGRIVFHLNSVVFRNVTETLPAWFLTTLTGDFPLFAILGGHGDFLRLPEVMSHYRIHEGGIFSIGGRTRTFHERKEHKIRQLAGTIDHYEKIDVHFGKKFRKVIHRKLAETCLDLAWEHRQMNQWQNIHPLLFKAWQLDVRLVYSHAPFFFKMLALSMIPILRRDFQAETSPQQ